MKVPAPAVEVVDTWYGLGLRASDSNDVAVKDLFVPKGQTTVFSPVYEPNRHFRGTLYRMPVMGSIVLASIPRSRSPSVAAPSRRCERCPQHLPSL